MPGRKDVDERVTLTAVRDAFLRGDFERCLALCERYHARGDADEVEIQLLEARALLPLNRAGQALDVLRRLQPSDDGTTSSSSRRCSPARRT
jgi:hypothetical protein